MSFPVNRKADLRMTQRVRMQTFTVPLQALTLIGFSACGFVIAGCAGSDGTSGVNALLAIVDEPAGEHCANGGSKVNYGPDLNANGVLD